ncbi:calcium/sodium antiporter [Nocardia mexicana]|uniref:calcium/sodium antiporter n=1 Tax=Nocardia mexicana TaxID=279262 RepID=UPI0020D26A18|nr:calcium/sodium antiporter [Nocardia mexicana]
MLGLLVGVIVLPYAADQLVLGSAHVARRLRIAPVVVGVIVIGLGTSAPEFLVSGTAAAHGDTGIALGNLIGSNILNITLVLGVAAAIRVVVVSATVVDREIVLSLVSVAAFAVLAAIGLTWWGGLVLSIAAVVALVLLVRWARTDHANQSVAEQAAEFSAEPDASRRPSMRGEVVRALLGLAGVLLGAQLLVTNAAGMAARFGVPEIVIGFTLVALGTSLPELMTTVQAQRRGETDLLVGNLFGSNLFNSLIGGGVVGVLSGTASPVRPHAGVLIAMVAVSVLAWLLLRRNFRITRIGSVILLGCYVLTVPVLLGT